MTEKRFTINLEDECIDDAEERIFISFLDKIDFYELCGFLNEQDEKIKELEEENEELKEIHQKGSKSCEKWKQHKEAQIQQLEKENEWLKKELKGLNRKYIAFSEATDKRLKEMMKEMMK